MRLTTTLKFLAIGVLFAPISLWGQLTIGAGQTPQQLVQNVLLGAGVTASNITFQGDPLQIAAFTNVGPNNLPLSSGIVMCTGGATVAAAANNVGGGSQVAVGPGFGAGDAQLSALAGGQATNDAAVLEFDFVPLSDTVKFRYVFASEEYNEYACSNFNDIFAFFLTGPGYPVATNIALIPNTTIPVAINTVNNGTVGTNGTLASCTPPLGSLANSQYFINNPNGAVHIEFDGLTVVLTATAVVTPCSTYHIKLAVADVFDSAFDSGVFLEANSFSTNFLNIQVATFNGDNTVIESCNSATITACIPAPADGVYAIPLFINGTATNGVDYVSIPDTLFIPDDSTCVSFELTPLFDNLPEGLETVELVFRSTVCTYDTVVLYINEYGNLFDIAQDSFTICEGTAENLPFQAYFLGSPTAPGAYSWSPTTGLNNPNIANPIATVSEPMVYTVTYQFGSCIQTDSIEIASPYAINLPPLSDTSICGGGSVPLNVTVSSGPGPSTFTFSPNQTYAPATIFNYPFNITGVNFPSTIANNTIGSVCVNITQPVMAHISVYLIAPNGQIVDLSTNNGFFGTGYSNVCFTPTATNLMGVNPNATIPANSTWRPEDPNGFADIYGSAINGQWTLRIVHTTAASSGGQTGRLVSFNITFNDPTAVSYAWTPTAGLSCTTCPTPTATPTATTTYQVVAQNQAGCTDTAQITINVDALTAPVVVCDTATSNSVTVAWAAVTGAGSYEVSVDGGPFINIGSATTYTATGLALCQTATISVVAVAAPNVACQNSAPVSVSCQTDCCNIPAPTITGIAQICAGDSSVLDAGAGYTTYLWNTGATTQTITVNTTLVYSVIVSDINNCTATATFSFVANAVPNPVIGGNLTICNGVSTTLDAVIPGNYSWSTGATTQTISVSTPGDYSVTVTGAGGCFGSDTVTVILSPSLSPVISASGPLSFCDPGSVDLTTSQFDQYSWLPNGETTQTITATTSGTYILNVSNNNGCAGSDTIVVTVFPSVQALAYADTALCAGGSATVGVSVSGGTAPYTLDWNNFAQNSNNVVVTPATTTLYNVVVTDDNGCTTTDAQVVTVNANPVVDAGANQSICFGATTTITATQTTSNPGPVYTWNNGLGIGASQSVSPAGSTTYEVTLTDTNGCTGTDSVAVNVSNPIALNITGNASICINSSATLNAIAAGGTGALSYSWTGGFNTPSITVTPLVTTTYTVTVTDQFGCTAQDTFQVIVSTQLFPQITSNTGQFAYCVGDSIILDAGIGFNTYTWSNGPTTQTIVVDQVGTYTVTVTDLGGCTGTGTVNVTENALPIPVVTNTGPYCAGTTAQLNASGGVLYVWSGPNTFSATGPVATISNISVLAAGQYDVTVTDANACSAVGSTTIVVNALPVPTASNDGPYCPGATATLTATGGTNYIWSGPNGFNANTAVGTIPAVTLADNGTFQVNVTDINGCTGTASTTILVNTPPSPTVIDKGPYCPLDTIRINASTAVSYAWTGPNGFASIDQFIVIPNATTFLSGTYSVIVTDANGCTGSTSVQVVVNPSPIPSAANTGPYCLGDDIQLSAGGGATYSWTGPASFASIGQNPLIANSTLAMAGIYNVLVTSADGCTATASTTVVVNDLPLVQLPADTAICISGSITVVPTVSNGPTPYTYQWSTGATTTSLPLQIFTPITAVVTVTDANGCSGSDAMFIDTIGSLPVTITSLTGGNLFCNGTSLSLSATAGYPFYTWSNGQTTQNISVITSGNYSVTVGDLAGCAGTASFNAIELLPITFTVNVLNVNCNGGNNGVAGVDNTFGGTGNYVAYNWSNGGTGAIVSGFTAGTYTVTVTDDLGCTASRSFTVTEPPQALGVSIVSADATCNGISNGVAVANAFGGTPNYAFEWSNGELDDTVTTLSANTTYYVTVTDAQGCVIIDSVVVNEPALIVPLLTLLDSTSCFGSADGSANVVASGGLPGYSYFWNNGEASATATALPAGLATVTVTDNLGCTVTSSILIPQPSQLALQIDSIAPQQCVGTGTGVVVVSASGGTPGYTYQWDQAAFGQTGPIATGLPAGTYRVTATDLNGCTVSITAQVLNAVVIDLNIVQTKLIECFGDSTAVLVSTATGGQTPYTYNWSNGDTLSSIDTVAAGLYTLTVTDANGCTISETVVVNQPAQLQLGTLVTAIPCYGEDQGLVVASATGGTLPYQFSNDGGQTYTSGTRFPGLGPVSYLFVVQDGNGCIDTSTISFSYPPQWSVSLPQDTSIEYGDQLPIPSTVTTTSPVTYVWLPDSTLSCNDCPTPIATPTISQIYHVFATDTFGCTRSDTMEVNVYLMRRLYVANLFSPNGDGNNDILMPQAGRGVSEILVFRIYDRWGEMVFEAIDMPANDPRTGWDGTFQGQPMNSAVFGWYLEVEYEDGFIEFRQGDATLVR